VLWFHCTPQQSVAHFAVECDEPTEIRAFRSMLKQGLYFLADPFVGRKTATKQVLQCITYTCEDGLLYWHDSVSKRLCVPAVLQKNLLHECHDTLIAGHMGIDCTHLALAKEYYWPRMHRDVRVYVNSCTTCQQYKASNEPPAGLARPLLIPDRPFWVWGLDFHYYSH
jgi:hypothetical protein